MSDDSKRQRRLRWLRRTAIGLTVTVGALLVFAAIAILLIPAEQRITTEWEAPARNPVVDTRPARAGTVFVDVLFVRGRGGNGQFTIEPVAAQQPLRVVAEYDTKAYRLEHGYDDEPQHGDAWTFRLRLQRRRWFPLNPHQYPQAVRLQLPRGTPLRLRGRVAWGESDIQLGGLSVVAVDLDLSLGSHELSFAEPLPRPLERLSVHSRIGSLQVRGLAHASPGAVELSHTVGDFAIDLDGPWQRDTDVQTGCFAAKCTARAPEQARLEFADGTPWPQGVAASSSQLGADSRRIRLTGAAAKFEIGRGTAVSVGADDMTDD